MKPAPSVCFHKTKSHFTRCTAVKGVLRMLHRPSACEIDSSKNRWICPIVHLRLLISGQCIMYTGKKKKNVTVQIRVRKKKSSVKKPVSLPPTLEPYHSSPCCPVPDSYCLQCLCTEYLYTQMVVRQEGRGQTTAFKRMAQPSGIQNKLLRTD